MTPRGQILVSRTDDDPPHPALRVSIQNVPVCAFKASPCVPAPRAHVFQHVRVVPAYTGRFACTHGGVLNPHTGLFSVPQPQRHTHHRPHQDTTCTPTLNITRRHRQRETEKRRQRKRDPAMLVMSIADVGKDSAEAQTDVEDPLIQYEESTVESFSGRFKELVFIWCISFAVLSVR